MSHSDQITIRFPASWLEAIDLRRGGLNRSIYLRRVVQRALRLPTVPEARGRGEAIAVGIMSPATLNKELERRAAEKRRSAKREAKQRPKPVPPPPTFVFHDNGIVGSPDLDVQATFCGLVREDGKYEPETTRHSESVIRQAVRQALTAGLLSGERWERFVARGDTRRR